MADGSETQAGSGAAIETARGVGERRELSRRAQAVARRVAEAKATIPHLYLGRTVRSSGTLDGPELARVIAAAGQVLAEDPALNCAYRDGGVEVRTRVNVGLVIELGDEAVAPTIFDADSKRAPEIAAEIESLRDRAGRGELTSPDLAGGTFTVSSVPDGAGWMAAPVTPGQAAHLTVAGSEGGLALTLSCDQRAVRAPAAARFLASLADALGDEPDSGSS